jgi:hypothetical protein
LIRDSVSGTWLIQTMESKRKPPMRVTGSVGEAPGEAGGGAWPAEKGRLAPGTSKRGEF